MERVIITKPMLGLTAMQVCCIDDVTDEEILSECNGKNPSGTAKGWSVVLRTKKDLKKLKLPERCLPVKCDDSKDRTHFLVVC